MVENVARVYDQETIMEEINGLAAQRQGWVTLHLVGIRGTHIGIRTLWVNVWENEDLLDLMVAVRREWLTIIPFHDFNVYYVNPQPPPMA